MTMNLTRFRVLPSVLTFVLALCVARIALAQDMPIVRTGNTEIGGFVGASFGIDKARVMGGGNVAYAATRVVMPYVEFSYFPGIGRSMSKSVGAGGSTVKFNFQVPLYDFHGGVHLRVPVKDSRVIPYGVIGAGMIHTLKRTENVAISDSLGSFNIPVDVPARSDFALNFGGGLRFYVNERYGFRVEVKAYRPTGAFTNIFGKVEGGFFFQIK
jgi:hypothetical protein